MPRLTPIGIATAMAIAAASLAPAFAADKAGEGDRLPARETMTVEGPVLITPAGMSLYYYYTETTKPQGVDWQCLNVAPTKMNDQQSGIGERPNIGFKLVKSCAQKSLPYIADAAAKPVGDYTIVQRTEGTRQWAYKGFPLYTSPKDARPGDRNGMGAGGLFGAALSKFGGTSLANVPPGLPAGLSYVRGGAGLVLTSGNSARPLYTPRDGARVVRTGMRADDFTPVAAGALTHVSGDWSVVENGAGFKQYAFRGKPLYVPPADASDDQIAAAGGWDPVVVVRAPALPTAIGQHSTLLGDVFTDKRGRTLYVYSCITGGFLSGGRGAMIGCSDAGDPAAFMVALCGDAKECANRWHPYLAAADAKAEGEFAPIDITYPMFTDMRGRLYPSDAPHVKVWAYHGTPVFTYYRDQKPADIWGDNVGGIWGSSFGALVVPGRSAISSDF